MKQTLEYHRKWRQDNREKDRAYNRKAARKRRAEQPNKIRAINRKCTYGVTEIQFNAMFVTQGSVCKICRSNQHGGKGWHLDHDHFTNKVRGILCHCCNVGLGNFRDDPLRLELAADYLRKANL